MRLVRHFKNIGVSNHILGLYCLLLVFLPVGLSAQAINRTVSPRIELSKHLNDTLLKKILVLGTPHLRVLKDSLERTALDSLLTTLELYEPQAIAVEAMSSEMISSLESESGNGSVIVEAFAAKQIKQGKIMQHLLNTSRKQAQVIADSLLRVSGAPDIGTHLKQVAYLLTSYDYYSALLQWSYLPEDLRKHNGVFPDSVSTFLSNDLLNTNEITSLALPLAKRLTHQRIFPIDDHYDDLMLLPVNETLSSEVQDHPLFQEVARSGIYSQSDSLLRQANIKRNLLPYYLYLNSSDYMSTDIKTQWGLFLRTGLQSGLDRFRFTLWEIRNLNIASNILKAAPLAHHTRVLVIIGVAHKPFLDEYLGQMPDVQLVQIRDILR